MDDKDRVNEWTMHMAAGTDPLTAWAATPQVDDDDDSPRASILRFKGFWIGVAIGGALFFLWLLLK